ncbi:site-specific DNA-methyltransferase [Apibacter sp. B3924]|nr:site-specific DNA-methyltransferase [Apibacter sp. B3919]MXO25457.1 site-specific DNA-methyltransferase [Apibacter sp. B3924]MXO26889.1 site-specific DNA-methyltransferase [Apibacter sp. B3813]MXO28541.1 site-specific DNA-methyltransferase [Apibacter sp. B3913]MXO30495.1 site-specific DNA-methyltransferase [Apibacter sp. B3912]MXP02051.1 site-specific DNA-methyltransferase [Apibacter sp. B3918]
MEDNKLNLNAERKIDSVEEFKFEPIKGYPMLRWKGKRPFTSTQYYPAQLKEQHGEETDGWINQIFWGDNLQVMSHLLKKYRGQVDLIYIDPPYDSKADYKKKISLKGQSVENDNTAFEEKQYTDIWSNDEYLQFMYERLILMRELLSDTGSIYVHLDYRKSHHIRIIMDEIFGDGGSDLKGAGFKNEIAYGYRIQGVGKSAWARKHDTILFYSKTADHKFKPLKERIYYRKPFIDTLIDEEGRYYSDVYVRDIWYRDETRYKVELLIDEENNYYTENTFPDIWDADETRPFISGSKEYLSYPTQKPKGLLKRILGQMTDKGDLVFDCFMGSGTTQAVALELGLRYIGADINLGAVQTTTKRLIKVANELISQQNKIGFDDENKIENYYTGFQVYNVNNYDVFRNPVEAKDLLLKALEVQPMPNSMLYDGEKDGRFVKVMPVNRIATRADLNELIVNFDYKTFEKRHNESPNKPVESILLVCMGHEPDLAAHLKEQVPFPLDVKIVDVLRDKSNLEFKHDSDAEISIEGNRLLVREFYPMNLLQKLSIQKENVENWKEMTESIMIDFNYDGSIFEPQIVDIPEKNELVKGVYDIPKDSGTIHIKITDLLSETFEKTIK